MKLPLCLLAATAALAAAGDDTPAEQVKAAALKLAEAPNYSWLASVGSGEKSRFAPGPVEGRLEKGGCTHWTMSFGDRKSEAYVKDGRIAVKSGDTWVSPLETKEPPPPLPHGAPPPPHRDEHRSKGEHSKDRNDKPKDEGKRTGFFARRLQAMKPPAEFAADLAGKVNTLTASGDTFTGELSPDAARELLTFGPRGKHRDSHTPPEPANPRGTVKFTLKDGTLTRLELRLAATMSINNCDVPLDHTTVIEIKDIGTTKLDIPADAKALLAPPPA